MAGFLQLLRFLDDGNDPAETRPRNRNSPNRDHVASHHDDTPHQPRAKFNNTGTQNLRGLINNTGYTKGNGNGCFVLGDFDSSTRNYN